VGERAFLVFRFIVVLVLAVLVTLAALPSPMFAASWQPPRAPNLEGGFRPNDELARADRLLSGQVVGPESIAFDAADQLYAGTTDGKVIRMQRGGPVEVFAETGGRPLGMKLDASGNLWVADAMKGLLRIDADGNIEVMLSEVEGLPFGFLNDVVITQSGTVYVSDSSSKWPYGSQVFDILEAVPSGRVVRFEPATRTTTVIARGLAFANGLALSPDESYLLVCETARYRVARIWLQGDRKHLVETYVDNLPGFPDNISLSPRGTWWVALFSVRKPLLDLVHPYAFAKDTIAALPEALRPRHIPYGLVFEMNMSGQVLRSFHDTSGRSLRDTSSALERDGFLYVGTLTGTSIARVKLGELQPL
jgi:sugar lactone lactonase YvrE